MRREKLRSVMVLLLTMVIVCTSFVQATNVSYSVISKPQWDEVRSFSEGMAAVKKVVVVKKAGSEEYNIELWGFINSNGQIVVEPKYEDVGDFHEGLAYALNIEKNCIEFIDKQGKVIIDGNKLLAAKYAAKGLEFKPGDTTYYGATDCNGGILGLMKEGTLAIDYYDIKGNPIIARNGIFDSFYGLQFSEGVGCIQFEATQKVAFIDKTGKITYVNDGKDGEICPFNQGLAFAAIYIEQKLANGNVDRVAKWGVIDKSGKYVIQPQYDDFLVSNTNTYFNDGLAVVKKGGKWGAINKSGKTVIKHNYFYLSVFYNGMAIYKMTDNGKYGIMDNAGKIIVKPIYDKIGFTSYPKDGPIAVQKAGKWGYIDAKGKEVIKIMYDDYSAFSNGIGLVKLGKEYLWIDKNGKKLGVLNEKIDGFFGIYQDGYIITKLNNKMGFIKLK